MVTMREVSQYDLLLFCWKGMIMYEYSKEKIVQEKPYRQMQFKYDLLYIKLVRADENNRFWDKYCRLNEQLKAEEQY